MVLGVWEVIPLGKSTALQATGQGQEVRGHSEGVQIGGRRKPQHSYSLDWALIMGLGAAIKQLWEPGSGVCGDPGAVTYLQSPWPIFREFRGLGRR